VFQVFLHLQGRELRHGVDGAMDGQGTVLAAGFLAAVVDDKLRDMTYPLVNKHSYLKWPLIVDLPDLPMNSMVMFHSYVRYVSLPEGILFILGMKILYERGISFLTSMTSIVVPMKSSMCRFPSHDRLA